MVTPGIPIPLHAKRDLSQFIADDNSPPTSRSTPQASDGRDLSTISHFNFPRGGHRLDPATSSSTGGGKPKSNQAPKGTPCSGKSAVQPSFPLHETAPSGAQSMPEYGKTKSGKTKSNLYLSYLLGKGKTEPSTFGKSKPKG